MKWQMEPIEYNCKEYETFYSIENISEPTINTNITTIDKFEYKIQYYMYTSNNLNYISNYIYPFYKKEFLKEKENKNNDFNPCANWSNNDLVRYHMGLKENTMCFQLIISDIPIGFCCLLLLDEFDQTDRFSPFSNELYKGSVVLYNFVIQKEFRKEGYAKKLLDFIVDYIEQNNKYKSIMLYVDQENEIAKKLYEKKKFIYIGKNPVQLEQDLYRFSF